MISVLPNPPDRAETLPDIVGIDSDGNVCIVEMKNVAINASIIPQVLAYAFWAQEKLL